MKVYIAVEAFEVQNSLLTSYIDENVDGVRDLAKWSDILSSLKEVPEARYAIMKQIFGRVPNTAERHQIYTELGRIAKAVRDLPAGAVLVTG